jgi:hypothetical protein
MPSERFPPDDPCEWLRSAWSDLAQARADPCSPDDPPHSLLLSMGTSPFSSSVLTIRWLIEQREASCGIMWITKMTLTN